MGVPKVVIDDRIRIDRRLVSKKQILDRYKVTLYDELACQRCDNLPNRFNELCKECPAFGGNYNLAWPEESEVGDWPHWSLPIGDIQYVGEELLGEKEFSLKKKYKLKKFDHDVQFTGKLFGPNEVDSDGNPRTNQIELVDKWMETKNGVIRARPRAGKTVMSVAIATQLGVKTLIVAHQHEILEQFRASFAGNAAKTRKPMTNVGKLEKKVGKGKVVKIIQSVHDFYDEPDIAIITYQSLLADLTRIKKYCNRRYSLLICDELHRAGADGYSKVIARLSMPYRLGLSATTDRKDGREILTERTLGPVVAESNTYTLVPTIYAHFMKAQPPTDYKSWNSCLKYVANDPKRNQEIIKLVFKDLRAGHKVIILPVFWRNHQQALVEAINHQAKINRKRKGEKWPRDLAQALHGQADRQAVLNRVDNGEPCVLIAINGMIKEAIDMKMPTKLFLVVPTSAVAEVGAPMFMQLSYRVCTPMPGKRQPEITLLVDEGLTMFKGCLQGLFWNEIVPGLRKNNFKYRLGPNTYEQLASLNKKKPKMGGGNRRAFAGGGGWV